MEGWVGPAIVAAFISGLVSLVVVQLNVAQSRKTDRLRREEKVRDFQIALRAEIRSELRNLQRYDVDIQLTEIRTRLAAQPLHLPSVPRLAKHPVFDALVSEIHILPEHVIDPVVLYARQRQVMESLVEDLRDPAFKALGSEQQLSIYEDYVRMWETWRDFAAQAELALSGDSASVKRPGAGLSGNRLGSG